MRRITPATVTVTVLLAFGGLVGAYFVKDALRPRRQPVDIVKNVLVAIADLPTDAVITAEDVGRVDIPRSQIPSGAIMERQALVGRRLKQPLKQLGVFTGAAFYPIGGGPTLSTRLKPGFRAVTIEAAPGSAGLSGLVRPGDLVDVLLTVDPGNRATQLKSETTLSLLQGVEVLAVDRNIDQTNTPVNQSSTLSVTVAVSPDDANALVLAKGNGKLQLALRSPNEEPAAGAPRRWTLDDLLGFGPMPEPTDEAAPKTFLSEIFRGTNHEEVEFEVTKGGSRKVPGGGSQGSPPGRVRRGQAARLNGTPQPAQPASGLPNNRNRAATPAPQAS